jgi:hypothetical protein
MFEQYLRDLEQLRGSLPRDDFIMLRGLLFSLKEYVEFPGSLKELRQQTAEPFSNEEFYLNKIRRYLPVTKL